MSLRPMAFAMRARQLELRDTPFTDARGERIAASFARWLDLGAQGDDRIALLLARAITEAEVTSRRSRSLPASPMLVVAPPTDGPDADRVLLARLHELLGRAPASSSSVIRASHDGAALALREARAMLREGTHEVIVAAASTPLDGKMLATLDARGNLHGEGRRGRIPGEAAAALRLGLRRPTSTFAQLAEVEHEHDAAATPGACGQILRRARGAVTSGAFDLAIIDVNGEEARAAAWELDVQAAGSALTDVAVEAWPDLTGDLGPASGVLFAAVAIELAACSASPNRNVAIALRGDEGAVSVIAIDLPIVAGDFAESSTEPVRRRLSRRRPTAPAEEQAFAARIARGLFEDLAAMGLLLAPGEAGPDRQAAARRLLDTYDALCALAMPGHGIAPSIDLVAVMERWVAEVDPPDRGRRFAATFLRAHISR